MLSCVATSPSLRTRFLRYLDRTGTQVIELNSPDMDEDEPHPPIDQTIYDIATCCPNLAGFVLYDETVPGSMCVLLDRCNKLKMLKIDCCNGITQSIVLAICKSPSLTSLEIMRTEFAPHATAFANCRNKVLIKVDIDQETSLSWDQKINFMGKFANLTEVGYVTLPNRCLVAFSAFTPHMRKVQFRAESALSDDSLFSATSKWPKLECLQVNMDHNEYNYVLSGAALVGIIRTCKLLRMLSIGPCNYEDEEWRSHKTEPSHKSQLRFLCVGSIRATKFQQIIDICPLLTNVSIDAAVETTEEPRLIPVDQIEHVLDYWSSRIKHIQSLHIFGCTIPLQCCSLLTFVNLKDLRLCGLRNPALNAQKLLRIVSKSPNLGRLHVKDVDSEDHTAVVERVLQLCPKMRTFWYDFTGSCIADFAEESMSRLRRQYPYLDHLFFRLKGTISFCN